VTNARYRLRWMAHNLIGHGVGLGLVAFVAPSLGEWLHDITIPIGHELEEHA
jgi:hypothetical protein